MTAPNGELPARQHELRDLLRTCRERLDPAMLGIADLGRRHRRGVNQHEVAAALKLSTRRYLDIENGRATPNPDQLAAIAEVLRMTPDERVSWYLLATATRPVPPFPPSGELPDGMADIVRRIHVQPTIVMDPAWNYRAWNRAFTHWFHDPGRDPAADRNALLWLYSDHAAQRIVEIDQVRESRLAEFRAAYARFPGEPAFHTVIARLLHRPQARELWRQHLVREPRVLEGGHVRHPTTGRNVETQLLRNELPSAASLRLVVFLVADDHDVPGIRS